MGRWLEKDAASLDEIKTLLKDDLDNYPPYPEVVGDRRLLRFIKGFSGNVEKAADGYRKFLKWRKDAGVDIIRNKILYGNVNHPKDFPCGEIILDVLPQIVVSPHAYDYKRQPITLEVLLLSPPPPITLLFLILSL